MPLAAFVAALVSLAVSLPVPSTSAGTVQAKARAIEVVVGDSMSFKPATLSARPGERLTILLRDAGKMPKDVMGHNFVLMANGADPEAYVEAAASARGTEFIVPSLKKQVLAFTKLVGPGETASVTFEAPREPGAYLFICTFPGHYAAGMKGTLTVK